MVHAYTWQIPLPRGVSVDRVEPSSATNWLCVQVLEWPFAVVLEGMSIFWDSPVTLNRSSICRDVVHGQVALIKWFCSLCTVVWLCVKIARVWTIFFGIICFFNHALVTRDLWAKFKAKSDRSIRIRGLSSLKMASVRDLLAESPND